MNDTEKITKELYASKFYPSAGKFIVLNPSTLKEEEVSEKGVLGRFVRVRQLNSFKSRETGKPVYDEVDVCQIKVDNPGATDIVAHRINKENLAAFMNRFPKAYKEFAANAPAKDKKTLEREALITRALALNIDLPETLSDADLEKVVAEKERQN